MSRDKWLIFCMCCVPSWLSGIQVTERSHRGEIGNPISISRSPYGIEKEPIINSENYTVCVQWMNKWELFCVICLRNTSKKYNKLGFITGWSLKSISLTWQKNSSMIREVHCRCSSQSFAGLLMSATWRINSNAWLFSTWLENEKGNKMLRSRVWFDTFKCKNINLWQPWLRVKVPWRLLCYCYPNGLPLNNTVRRGRGRERGGALTRKYWQLIRIVFEMSYRVSFWCEKWAYN